MKRSEEWFRFSEEVAKHVTEYTVPQYGDWPTDQLTDYSPEDCIRQIAKYANRHFSGQRGKVELARDLLKIAHYACVCWSKESEEE